MRCHTFGRRLWSGWRALSARSRGPMAAASVIAGSVGAVLMLIPAGAAWTNSSIADLLASAAILDWVKGPLGLIFLLRRQLGTAHGDQQ